MFCSTFPKRPVGFLNAHPILRLHTLKTTSKVWNNLPESTCAYTLDITHSQTPTVEASSILSPMYKTEPWVLKQSLGPKTEPWVLKQSLGPVSDGTGTVSDLILITTSCCQKTNYIAVSQHGRLLSWFFTLSEAFNRSDCVSTFRTLYTITQLSWAWICLQWPVSWCCFVFPK